MLKKFVLGVLVLLILVSVGLYLWVRSVFSQDNMRTAVAMELTDILGQPVVVGRIGASFYPRITLALGDVSVGQPARVQITSLDLGTDFRALLSRRIEHATARVEGARVELPLPPFRQGRDEARPPRDQPASPDSTQSKPPVEIVSIDEVLFRDITIVSGGRTLKADIDAVPTGSGVTLRRIVMSVDDTSIEATGNISNLSGPVGILDVKAGQLDFDQLMAFLNDFASGTGIVGTPPAPRDTPASSGTKPDLKITLEAARVTAGQLVLENLKGHAVVNNTGVTIDPASFGIFGGKYDGRLLARLSDSTPVFTFRANVSGIDVAELTTFATSGGRPLTGRLTGVIDLTGSGIDLTTAIKTVKGSARLDIADGVVKGLQLVRTVVLATSGRADSSSQAFASNPEGELFRQLGATLAIAGGSATTHDLSFESTDVSFKAGGTIALNGSSVNLHGTVQLSPELSQQAGRDLFRYTAQDNRVTLPATVTGSAGNLSVKLDVADAARRALVNKAKEETQKAIQRGIGSLFKRKPPQ